MRVCTLLQRLSPMSLRLIILEQFCRNRKSGSKNQHRFSHPQNSFFTKFQQYKLNVTLKKSVFTKISRVLRIILRFIIIEIICYSVYKKKYSISIDYKKNDFFKKNITLKNRYYVTAGRKTVKPFQRRVWSSQNFEMKIEMFLVFYSIRSENFRSFGRLTKKFFLTCESLPTVLSCFSLFVPSNLILRSEK